MANGEISLASAALAVALTALVIAIGQLLQQVFSTAEGYRRCQDSVLGDWAHRNRLKWRWSQFRFEVKFTTPELVLRTNLDVVKDFHITARSRTERYHAVFPIDYTGRNAPSKSIQRPGEQSTDLVGWINLLKQLQFLSSAFWGELEAIDISKQSVPTKHVVLSPAWVPREWSWDLMPPDIIRPLATTTIGTLVVLAHRLGMVWRDLRPSQGNLRAEGNGHSISATFSRGIGLLVQYTYDDTYNPSPSALEKHARIPTEAADKLACGIIPGFELLGLSDIHLVPNYSLQDETPKNPNDWTLPPTSLAMIASSLRSIGVSEDAIAAITGARGCCQLVSELRSMFCPFLPIRGSTITTVFNALRADVEHFAYREAKITMRHLLQKYLRRFPDSSPHIHGLLSHLDTFQTKWRWRFENTFYFQHDPNGRPPLELIEFAHDVWKGRQEIVEAWWTLMVRAIFFSCTLRYLPYAEFPAVASAFHASRTPVYITQ